MAARPKRLTSRPLAEFVPATIGPIAARQGFGEAALLLGWADIVGPRLADRTQPIALQWPRRGKGAPRAAEPGTLVVRVQSAFALELQHSLDLLRDRVNTHLGWTCVGRIVLKQGPIARAPKPPPRGGPPSPSALAAAAARCEVIQDDDLRAALVRLGARIMRR